MENFPSHQIAHTTDTPVNFVSHLDLLIYSIIANYDLRFFIKQGS